MHKIQLKETRQIGRVLDKQSKFRGWSGMIGVCNSIFPLENLRYAIILIQKRKSSHSKNVVIPDKKIVFPFFSQKDSRIFHYSKAKIFFFHIPSFLFSPRSKWEYRVLQEWVSAWDKRHVNWFLLFSFFPILWQERKQAEEDSIPTAKRKRRETKEIKRKIFQDLFFIVTGQEKVPQNAYRSRLVHPALPDSSLA